MRVSPSGKAVASQATIHGFESRHPLYQKTASIAVVFFNLLDPTEESYMKEPFHILTTLY